MSENVLGERIKKLREEKEISQSELSKFLNIANSTLSQYESGKRIPSDAVKIKIAQYFNTSVDYLIGNSEINKSSKQNSESNKEIPLSDKEIKDILDYTDNVIDNFMFNAFKGELPTDDKDKEKVREAVYNAFLKMKIRNKIKYNSYKNKNAKE